MLPINDLSDAFRRKYDVFYMTNTVKLVFNNTAGTEVLKPEKLSKEFAREHCVCAELKIQDNTEIPSLFLRTSSSGSWRELRIFERIAKTEEAAPTEAPEETLAYEFGLCGLQAMYGDDDDDVDQGPAPPIDDDEHGAAAEEEHAKHLEMVDEINELGADDDGDKPEDGGN